MVVGVDSVVPLVFYWDLVAIGGLDQGFGSDVVVVGYQKLYLLVLDIGG